MSESNRWLVTIVIAVLVLAVALGMPRQAAAQPSGTSSITLAQGESGTLFVTSNAAPSFSCGCLVFQGGVSGSTPSWTITVIASANATPGSYTGTVFSPDPLGSYSVSVTITAGTTTTTQPPTTTTTRPTTTTTRPTTTTTTTTTTTLAPTTTTVPTTTTTLATTTTTRATTTTTTTTVAPTTTTTLVPPTSIAEESENALPTGLLIGGAAGLAALLGGAALIGTRRRRGSQRGPITSGPGLGVQRWSAKRSAERRRKGGPGRKRYYGPEWYREWRSARASEREVRRRIAERQRKQ